MPNWTSNTVTIKAGKTTLAKIKKLLASEENGIVDFQKIVPMPNDLLMESGGIASYAIDAAKAKKGTKAYNDAVNHSHLPRTVDLYCGKENVVISTEDELVALGQAYLENEKKYGHRDWYNWSLANWGTKWNACDCSLTESDGMLEYEFDTAWTAPEPVIEALSAMFPRTEITLSCSYEDPEPWMIYSTVYKGGKEIGSYTEEDEDLKAEYDDDEYDDDEYDDDDEVEEDGEIEESA